MNLIQAHNRALKNDLAKVTYNKVRDKLVPQITSGMEAAFLLVLHDKYGFGTKRLNEVKALVDNQFDCIIGKYATIDEIKEVVEKDLKVKL